MSPSADPYTAPDAEWILRRLSEVTGRLFEDPEIPINHVGIDSIDGMQVLGDLEDTFGVTLELAHLLDGATAQGLATRIARMRAAPRPASGTGDATAATAATAKEPCSPTLQQERAVREALAGAADGVAFRSHIAVAFDIFGSTAAAVSDALRELVVRHDALRLTFRFEGDAITQHVQPIGRWAPEHCGADELPSRFRQLAETPFELRRDLPIRALLAASEDRRLSLALVIHHAVADAASVAVLISELGAMLEGQTLEEAPSFVAWAAQTRGADVAPPEEWQAFEQPIAFGNAPVVQVAQTIMRPLPALVWQSAERVALSAGLTRNALLFASFSLAVLAHARQSSAVVDAVSSRRVGKLRAGLVGYVAENLAAPLSVDGTGFAHAVDESWPDQAALIATLSELEAQRQAAELSGWYRSTLDHLRRAEALNALPLSVCFNGQPRGLVEGFEGQHVQVTPSLALMESAIQHCLGVIGYVLPAHGAALLSLVYAPDRVSGAWCEAVVDRWVRVLKSAGVVGW